MNDIYSKMKCVLLFGKFWTTHPWVE